NGDISGGEALTERLTQLLAEIARTGEDRIDLTPEPTVILVAGVNGTGKTTTVGKLAWHLRKELGRTVVLGAADTFRAAGVEQLELRGERAGVGCVKGQHGDAPRAGADDTIDAGRREL